MLTSDIKDDYNIAIEIINNLKPNKVMMTLLLKSLYKENRDRFLTSILGKGNLTNDVFLVVDGYVGLNLEWAALFLTIKKHISKTQMIADVEMKIIEEMILKLTIDHIKHIGGTKIIKDIKIKLNYE